MPIMGHILTGRPTCQDLQTRVYPRLAMDPSLTQVLGREACKRWQHCALLTRECASSSLIDLVTSSSSGDASFTKWL